MKKELLFNIRLFNALSKKFHLGYKARLSKDRGEPNKLVEIGYYSGSKKAKSYFALMEVWKDEAGEFYLYIMVQNNGSRWVPPTVDDVECFRSKHVRGVLDKALDMLIQDVISAISESFYAEKLLLDF